MDDWDDEGFSGPSTGTADEEEEESYYEEEEEDSTGGIVPASNCRKCKKKCWDDDDEPSGCCPCGEEFDEVHCALGSLTKKVCDIQNTQEEQDVCLSDIKTGVATNE